MLTLDRYLPGVPCWADTSQPDISAATDFYSELFGWTTSDAGASGSPQPYLVAATPDGTAAAITGFAEGIPQIPTWNTYVRVVSADETAERVVLNGGLLLQAPFDVPDQGRMATLADPAGAAFMVWESHGHDGASAVNAHGAVNFNDLFASDLAQARAFYRATFGWEFLDLGPGQRFFVLPGYGDHLDQLRPGFLDAMSNMHAPKGFENVVASVQPTTADATTVGSHWGVTFGIDDVDAATARAFRLGATVKIAPFDAPWVRRAVLADPAGAVFALNEFRGK